MSLRLPPDICFLCLSRDRKIFDLSANIRHLFGFLTDWYPQTDARVCWECRATVEKLLRFKEQAKKAVCALERARTGLQPMSFKCLSKVYGTQTLLIDLLVNADAVTMSDYDSFYKTYSTIPNKYEVEVEFDEMKPKVTGEIKVEIDVDEDEIDESTPDHIVQDDTERINLPQTKLRIDAPSTSAEGITSKSEKVQKSSAIKKTERTNKTKMKREKAIVRRIRRKFTMAEVLKKKERRAEELKYRLYQQGKSYECDHCGKKLDSRKQILQHMRDHSKSIDCEQCSYKCRTLSRLKEHLLIHLDPSQRPLECQVCHNRFTTKYKLLEHTRRHTGERPFKCDACEKAFVSKEALIRHNNCKHVNRDPLTKKVCAQPKKNTSHTLAIGAHSKRNLASQYNCNYNIIKNSGNITYECKICKEIYAPVNAFYKHYTSAHKKDIPCAECNKTFKYPSLLAYHVNIVHRGEKPHLCNICGARFSIKQRLLGHMSSHSNEKHFKCDECLATFKYRSGLYTHKQIHKGEKPHQCDICAARFTYKGTLIGHMKVHTKDRPFECDICNKKFPWKRNLKNHLKTHLKEQQYIPLL